MEWIDNHPLWDVMRWPVWVATFIVVAYYTGKVFYRLALFLRGCVSAYETLPVSYFSGTKKDFTFISLILAETFSHKIDESGMFQRQTLMQFLVYKHPQVLELWAAHNPVHFARLVAENPLDYKSVRVECDDCGGANVSVSQRIDQP